jgi:hypothetical protein
VRQRSRRGPNNSAAIRARLKRIGAYLKATRKEVFRESLATFSGRLGISITTLCAMEDGNPGVHIGTWMAAFEVMQVAEGVLEASKPGLLLINAYATHAESNFPSSALTHTHSRRRSSAG